MNEAVEADITVEEGGQWCILLPCSDTEHWAVPQNVLAEIVTLPADQEHPPEELDWRGKSVPVLDLGRPGDPSWGERVGSAGLVAVFRGLSGETCDYWGLALRGEGLAVRRVHPTEVEEATEAVSEHATAAFRMAGVTYQVPDLISFQRRLAANTNAA